MDLTEDLVAAEWRKIVPPRFYSAHLDAADQPSAILEPAHGWLRRSLGDAPGSLLIVGSVGTGKTYLTCALAEAWWRSKQECARCRESAGTTIECRGCGATLPLERPEAGATPCAFCVPCHQTASPLASCDRLHLRDRSRRPLFTPTVDLLDALRPGGEGELDEYKLAGLLILDDLGAEKPTDWTAERFYALVNFRWLQQLPTVATSNLSLIALSRAVGERIVDRLRDGGVVIQTAGASRRRAAG